MRKLTLLLCLTLTQQLFSQVQLEGYVFEKDNRGFLNEVKITILGMDKTIKAETHTNIDGLFKAELDPEQKFIVRAEKRLFDVKQDTVSTIGKTAGENVYAKIQLIRQPGYLFDATLAESLWGGGASGGKEALIDSRIEIYNNTTEKEELVLEKHPYPAFQFTFEQGNHYTIMIRKHGFLTKRLEARINVDGCILCFEGLSNVRPEISDNLTSGNQMGTLVANIELQKVQLNKSVKIENIYYDYNKWDIRSDAAVELDKVVSLIKDNPAIVLELGSHTDSRGQDGYNLELSDKRAKSAVQYIMEKGSIDATKIKAKGYGETSIINRCRNGVECTDKEHEQNRRTEIKIIGYNKPDSLTEIKSLRDILYDEKMERFLSGKFDTQVIEVKKDGSLPKDLQEQLDKQAKELEKPKNNEQATPPKPHEGNGGSSQATETGEFRDENEAEQNESAAKIVSQPEVAPTSTTFKKIKELAATYSGYKIEIKNTPAELPASNEIFSKHGDITLEKTKHGTFSYLLGDFKKEKDAKTFLDNILSNRYPDAKIVSFRNGRRIE